MSWKCQDCGAVWAPSFVGPCPHPVQIVTAGDTNPPHTHEYEGYATTGGPRCIVCRRTPPEIPNSTVSWPNATFTTVHS